MPHLSIMKSKPLKSEKDRKAACLAKQNSENLMKSPSKTKEIDLDNKMAIETPDNLKLQKSSTTTLQ